MQIVEMGDCSMVIMKDSEDPPWVSVGDAYRKAHEYNTQIRVENDEHSLKASDAIYSAGRLVLFFKEDIEGMFQLHDRVTLNAVSIRRSRRR